MNYFVPVFLQLLEVIWEKNLSHGKAGVLAAPVQALPVALLYF